MASSATAIVILLASIIPFRFDADHLVVVDAYLNEHGPFAMVVDTGATTTMLDESIASVLGLTPSGRVELITATGVHDAAEGTLQRLVVGGADARGLRVSWTRLTRLRGIDPRLAGVIGQDVLGGATVTIDYGRRQVVLGRSGCAPADRAVPVAASDGRPMVDAKVFAPVQPGAARLILDSAADTPVLFTAPGDGRLARAESHGSAARRASMMPARIGVGGVWLEADVASIGDADRREDGLLPTSLFKVVCIDRIRSRASFTSW
jgi:hypothetical protein